MPEMPLHAPFTMPAYERWLEEDATGEDVIGGGTLIALDGGRVVGFAGLVRRAADPLLAEHGFTGVAATHRGRGIATLLKRSQIAWAARSGYRELMTATQFDNAPMRAINDRLGYEALPAWIRVEAPLDEIEAALALSGLAARHASARAAGRAPAPVASGATPSAARARRHACRSVRRASR